MKIRKLASFFRAHGFEHELVRRVGNTALYRRSRNGIVHFEVIRIRVGKLHPLDQNRDGVDAAETYPPSSAWGSDGWTFRTLEEAETRFSTHARMPANVSV